MKAINNFLPITIGLGRLRTRKSINCSGTVSTNNNNTNNNNNNKHQIFYQNRQHDHKANIWLAMIIFTETILIHTTSPAFLEGPILYLSFNKHYSTSLQYIMYAYWPKWNYIINTFKLKKIGLDGMILALSINSSRNIPLLIALADPKGW